MKMRTEQSLSSSTMAGYTNCTFKICPLPVDDICTSHTVRESPCHFCHIFWKDEKLLVAFAKRRGTDGDGMMADASGTGVLSKSSSK